MTIYSLFKWEIGRESQSKYLPELVGQAGALVKFLKESSSFVQTQKSGVQWGLWLAEIVKPIQ